MTDLRVIDHRVFDEHLDHIERVKSTFSTELRDGIQQCEDRLHLLRLSLESTEELLDEARRDLSSALENDENRDGDRIERLIDEVDELARERDRKRRAVEEGSAALRRLNEYAETAEHDFSRAAFRASVNMTENKVRYREYLAVDIGAASLLGGHPQSIGQGSRGGVGPAEPADALRKVSPARARSRPTLPAGMEWVPLEALDWSGIDEDLEFKKAGRDEIQSMMRTFVETIVPMLSVDPDLSPDRLAAVDARRQRMPGDPDSLVGAWERLVSGSDRIAVDTSRGKGQAFSIQSGRHRILAARDIGLTHVPAIVSQTTKCKGEHQ